MTAMSPVPTYEEFLDWCKSQEDELAVEAVLIATNTDGRNRQGLNRQGHLKRGYLAAAQYLRRHEAIRSRLSETPRSKSKPVNVRDEAFSQSWLQFLKTNQKRHAILRHVLPTSLGGDIVDGGGGAYPFKVALRLAADYIDSTAPQKRRKIPADRYKMVRRKEFDRDSEMVKELKSLYEHRCQVCGSRIHTGNGAYYSEGHHLRPLGRAHGGSDSRDNVIILCPGHHVEFDYFLIAVLDLKGRTRAMEHVERRLSKRESTLTVRHTIARDNLDYVVEQFLTRLDMYFS